MDNYINKSYSSIHILKWKKYFQEDSADKGQGEELKLPVVK